jgi:DUF4097 and DUF4098 domain-containing protein YvlB
MPISVSQPIAHPTTLPRPALLIVLCCLMLVPLSRADEWSKTYQISNHPDLRVDTSDGNVRVDTWDNNTIDAHVTTSGWKIGEGGIKINEHQSGDMVQLEVRFPHQVFSLGFNHRVDIEIHMPRQGRVSVHTGDGNIQLASFKGDVNLESGDGAETIESLEGNLHAHSGDGNVRATGRFDSLDLSTGDGRIEAEATTGSSLNSGWSLRSGDGDIALRLPDKLSADIELRTGDGHITVDVPLAVEGRMSGNDIRGKLNGGGNTLTIQTGDGSIRLEKSSGV